MEGRREANGAGLESSEGEAEVMHVKGFSADAEAVAEGIRRGSPHPRERCGGRTDASEEEVLRREV